jgi:glycosyltransferase involved in cell wall biosynthesis
VIDSGSTRCLFVTNHAHLPYRVGGSESTTHELCLALTRRGWKCAVLAGVTPVQLPTPVRRLVGRFINGPAATDDVMQYPVYRCLSVLRSVQWAVRNFGPSVAIVQAGSPMPLVHALMKIGVPTILYLHDVEFTNLGGVLTANDKLAVIANSSFTALRTFETFGVQPVVVPPFVNPDAYSVESSRRTVVFVNPHPVKGADIAFALAERRPDIPFVFQEAWELSPEYARSCRTRAAALANVEWRPRTLDMRSVYRDAKVLLVPSRWQEAWGRVVTEAQISGIPAIASRRGGLPEAVGPGGILVDPKAGLSEWEGALGALWDDPTQYAKAVTGAIGHSRRSEINADIVLSQFKECVLCHIARSRVS